MRKTKSKMYKFVFSLFLLTTITTVVGLPTIGNFAIGTQEVQAASKYHEGVTKVTAVNWHTSRIYISKSTLRKMGNGLTVGGIWIPKFAVSGFVSTAGFALSNAPGGIWFDYDRALSGFGGGYGAPHWQ